MSRFIAFLSVGLMAMPSLSFANPFCDEWAKYIDAFDMIPARVKELPYSMEKYNGDLVKGAMSFGDRIIFVPEPSKQLLKGWPNANTPIILEDQLKKFYETKKVYNKKVSDLYKEKGNDQAIKLLQGGIFKNEEDLIVAAAKDIKEIALGKGNGDTSKICFPAYQKLAHERFAEMNKESYRLGRAVMALNADLSICTSRDPALSSQQLKNVEQIVEEVEKKEAKGASASKAQ